MFLSNRLRIDNNQPRWTILHRAATFLGDGALQDPADCPERGKIRGSSKRFPTPGTRTLRGEEIANDRRGQLYRGRKADCARDVCHGSDQVIFVRLTGSKPGALNSTLRLKSQLRSTSEAKGNRIVLSGEAPAARLRHFKRWCGDLRIVQCRRSFHPSDEDLSPGTPALGSRLLGCGGFTLQYL